MTRSDLTQYLIAIALCLAFAAAGWWWGNVAVVLVGLVFAGVFAWWFVQDLRGRNE